MTIKRTLSIEFKCQGDGCASPPLSLANESDALIGTGWGILTTYHVEGPITTTHLCGACAVKATPKSVRDPVVQAAADAKATAEAQAAAAAKAQADAKAKVATT